MRFIKLTNENFTFKLESVSSIEFGEVKNNDTKEFETHAFIAFEGGHGKHIRNVEDIKKLEEIFESLAE